MKKVTTVFDTRKIDQLRNHPLNAKVFGELAKDGVDAEFVESVRQHGILQPIVITKDNLILSGHRRRQAAARAGLKEVPVIVRHDLNGGIESDFAWFETNRNREMTVEQRAKWYEVRAKIEELAAKERQAAAGGDKRVENSENSAEKALGKNLPKRSPKAKDIAAAEAGMSRPTAEKAVEVVHAIDEAESAGDVERAEDLRKTLNEKSVAEAHRKATGKAKAERKVFADRAWEKPFGELVRWCESREAACNGPLHHAKCEKALNDFAGHVQKWQQEFPS